MSASEHSEYPVTAECRVCGHEARSDSYGSWEVCVVHGRNAPCDIGAARDIVIDAIEETFLAHLPSAAVSRCAQEDVNIGLDAMRARFQTPEFREGERQ